MFGNVGKALALIREIRGVSQAEVARLAGTGKSQISKYETGREVPRLDTLKNVLHALEIGHFEFWYTVHLIDIQVANLDLREEIKLQLLSNETDAAFKRLIDEVMMLYHQVWSEKLRNPPKKH
jgi:transcriptional regulator with XRE-family HTH domain